MAGADRLNELTGLLDRRLDLPSGPLTVALSGGADSAALLWLVSRRGRDVTAIHVFHGLPASALMSTAAGQVAAFCGVPLEMVVVDPVGTAEHQLRDARHAALLTAAGDRPVLLAHTADDQAETVLMRVLRGTGVDGLAGIRPSRGPIRHPFLAVTRSEARELARLAGLPFRDDPANDQPEILRNRIRSSVLPVIEEALGRSPRDALVRLAENAAEDSRVLDELAERVLVQHRGASVRLPLGALRAVGDGVAARAVRRAVRSLGSPYPPPRLALARMLEVVHGRVAATEIEPRIRVEVIDAHLVLTDASEPVVPEVTAPRVLSAGSTRWSNWVFVSEPRPGPQVIPLSPRRLVVPTSQEPLVVRTIESGDTVTGRSATAALADAGVRAAQRPFWPVVTCGGEPVWLPGVRGRVWPGHPPGGYVAVVAFQEPNWQTSAP